MSEAKRGGLVPSTVTSLSRRIEAWRRSRRRLNEPMPEGLWREAVGLARMHGVHRVSQALRLGFEGLKKRTAVVVSKTGSLTPAPSALFVEVVGLSGGGGEAGQIELELESSGGFRLRLRDGSGRVDIAEVVEAFCRSAS